MMKTKNRNFVSKFTNELFLVPVILMIFFTNTYAQHVAQIDIDSTHQIIRGFGAANILNWRPDMTGYEIDNAFGIEEDQVGLSILRLRIPPDENSFDDNIPTAQAAHSYYGVKIIASPWSPPAWMKTNNSTIGGRLLEEYYEDYAEHLDSFVDFMEDNDVPIYAISIQNEPDANVDYESCFWNASEMLQFVKEYGSDAK
jgi:glucuronoarabinoxylan endo-1,4-beta-xylanase